MPYSAWPASIVGRLAKGQSGGRGKRRKNKGGTGQQRRSSNLGATERARKRAAGFVPSPNFAFIAEDPLRAKVVAVALQRLYSPSEFARDEEIGISSAAYVFKKLREKAIIELVEEVPVRGTVKHMHRANEAAFVSDADWGELAEALRPLFTGTILEDFSRRTTKSIETGHMFSRNDFALYWAPQDLDEIAYQEQVEMVNWIIEESKRVVCDTVQRRANGESPAGGSFPATFAVALFTSPTHAEYEAHREKVEKEEREAARSDEKKGKPKPKGSGKKRKAPGRKGRGKS